MLVLVHNKRMKLCLFVATLFFLFISSAHAQTPVEKFTGTGKPLIGNLFGPKKIPPPTPDQIDESIALYDQCKKEDMISKYYDCDCLSADFLQRRRLNPNEQQYVLVDQSRRQCANKVDIAGGSYQSCISWAPQLRGDYEQYCQCYANSFAKNFAKNPTDSVRGREIMMTRALTGCNNGNELAEKRARQNLINRLKQQGVYESLFPGARINLPAEQRSNLN